MNSSAQLYNASVRPRLPRRLPATGIPALHEKRRRWIALSVLLHLAFIWLLTTDFDFNSHNALVTERAQGAGGPGPAGGGGGGKRGTGGVREHVTYVQVAPPPVPVAPPTVLPPVVQPVVQRVVQPVVPPPEVPKPTEPIPEVKAEVKVDLPKVEAIAPTAGTGGGTGRDGTTGSGPGSGGGVGTGIGTGRGSGIGPGTGGGLQTNYPPSPTELFIPPLPMPDKVRGFHLIAEYDVDSTGKVVDFNFTHTRDGGYNKRLEEVLKSFKFRPGTTPDGKPVRMKAQIVYDF
jgi:hypothetical protein